MYSLKTHVRKRLNKKIKKIGRLVFDLIFLFFVLNQTSFSLLELGKGQRFWHQIILYNSYKIKKDPGKQIR